MDFNAFLTSLVSVGEQQVSDLHFRVGSPPLLRMGGTLAPARFAAMKAEDTLNIAKALTAGTGVDLDTMSDWDGAYSIPGQGRFRVNLFRQQDKVSIILRVITNEIPSVESLQLPEVVKTIAMEERGLVLVTGITGSGKSSTLAAMIDHVNHNKKGHILTVEDPVEYIYESDLCSINQREVGSDTESFVAALRGALRQDPDVILVGEMRDAETITTAIKAAETGHLVFSTLHTVDAAKTINRIVDTFPAAQQQQVRLQLAANLKAIVSQRLIPKIGGGRIPAVEIMRSTGLIQDCIENPEKTAEIRDAIMNGKDEYGMQLFDMHLKDLYSDGKITLEDAVAAASSPADFQRALSFE